jgi:hypothetical protein
MKQDKYDFLSKIFNLPSSRTYAKYILPGGHAPDGILYDVLYKQKEEFGGEIAIKMNDTEHSLPSDIVSWLGHGTLAFDSKKIKEKVMIDPISGEIVAFSQDAFELDMMLEELKQLQPVETAPKTEDPSRPTGEDLVQDIEGEAVAKKFMEEQGYSYKLKPQGEKTDENATELVEHYLVFIFMTWKKLAFTRQFVLAQYGLTTITSRFLIDVVRERN